MNSDDDCDDNAISALTEKLRQVQIEVEILKSSDAEKTRKIKKLEDSAKHLKKKAIKEDDHVLITKVSSFFLE
jgi:hypothetical protein